MRGNLSTASPGGCAGGGQPAAQPDRELEKENAVQNAHWKNVDEKLDELTIMVKDLSGKAGRRWESMMDKALWAVCAAVIAFLLGRVGL